MSVFSPRLRFLNYPIPEMLSKNQVKTITALHHKKFRHEENLFLAEGEKVVRDLLNSGWRVLTVYGTQEFFQKLSGSVLISKSTEIILVTDDELKKISAQTTPQHVLAVVEMPSEEKEINFEKGLKLVLDGISDPGNLGSLIRIADWFEIDEIICSENTVDCFNPKVVQSAMGSLFRVSIHYRDLSEVFKKNLSGKKLPVYGTVLDGTNIYEENLGVDGFILVGNESVGIGDDHLPFITKALTIPSYGGTKIDSLNVAVATGIVCAEFRRR